MLNAAKTARSRRTRSTLVSAVRDRLVASGSFTAEGIAADVGCTPGTFWAHFGTKDDAIGQAFAVALDELVELSRALFGPGGLPAGAPLHPEPWARDVVDRLVGYFEAHALLYRAAIARFPEHAPMRRMYRDAEVRTIDIVAGGLASHRSREDAAAIVAFCQGINNPIVLRSHPGDRMRAQLARALIALVASPDSPRAAAP